MASGAGARELFNKRDKSGTRKIALLDPVTIVRRFLNSQGPGSVRRAHTKGAHTHIRTHTLSHARGATMTPFVSRATRGTKKRAFIDALKYSLSENGRLSERVCTAFAGAFSFSPLSLPQEHLKTWFWDARRCPVISQGAESVSEERETRKEVS